MASSTSTVNASASTAGRSLSQPDLACGEHRLRVFLSWTLPDVRETRTCAVMEEVETAALLPAQVVGWLDIGKDQHSQTHTNGLSEKAFPALA
jgi:hypothetical protein